jgi:hypothetical protein
MTRPQTNKGPRISATAPVANTFPCGVLFAGPKTQRATRQNKKG